MLQQFQSPNRSKTPTATADVIACLNTKFKISFARSQPKRDRNYIQRGQLVFVFMLTLLRPIQSNADELRWCLDNFSPYHVFNDRRKTYEGPTVELMQKIAQGSGMTLTILPAASSARCLKLINSGDADVMTNIVDLPERSRFLHLFPIGAESPTTAIVRANEKRNLSHAYNIHKVTMVVVRSCHYDAKFTDFLNSYPKSKLIEVSDVTTALKILAKQRADIFIAPPLPDTQNALSQFPEGSFKIIASPWGDNQRVPIFLGASKTSLSSAQIERIRKSIDLIAEQVQGSSDSKRLSPPF